MKSKALKILCVSLLAIICILPIVAFAQSSSGVMSGLDVVAGQAGLKNSQLTDWRDIVLIILDAILGTLGFISVCLLIYGGFQWMTAAGDSGKVDSAKKIIRNAIIGLVVILLSLGIVNVVFGLMKVRVSTWG